MTQRASPAGVVGDFDDVTLTRFGETYRLSRRGDGFWIDMPDPMSPGSSARAERAVTMTTGSHNMQLYWFESGFTRVTGLLPFAWLRAERRWIPRLAAFVLPPTEALSAEFGQWNNVCLKCHSTNFRPHLDMDASGLRGADTQVSEFGIACEACHGPAEKHVAANQNPVRRYSMRSSDAPDATIVQPERLPHRQSTQVCGQCHGIFDITLTGTDLQQFRAHGFTYRPGDDLERTRPVSRAGWDEQFWSDGVPRAAGREYNALVGSGCYERGEMTCLSCHVMHQPAGDPRLRSEWADDQLTLLAEDEACLQCHPSFATDVAAHTHHPADSSGSRCYNCHMPHTAYGLLKGVRNHRVDSPSVANTLATGRPNACNQCHLDQTLAWTAERLQAWYGEPPPVLGEDERRYAAAVLWALKGDAAQRALVAWSFGWEPARAASGDANFDWTAPYLAELIDDPYEAVRIIAERSLRRLPGHGDAEYDLLGTPAARAQAKNAVLERWERAHPPPDDERRAERRARVLLRPDGSLRIDELARLLRLRDQRPISIFE